MKQVKNSIDDKAYNRVRRILSEYIWKKIHRELFNEIADQIDVPSIKLN